MAQAASENGGLAGAMERLRGLMGQACKQGEREISGASLATADDRGRVSIRTIFIAHTEDEGLLFFASRLSGKGVQMEHRARRRAGAARARAHSRHGRRNRS